MHMRMGLDRTIKPSTLESAMMNAVPLRQRLVAAVLLAVIAIALHAVYIMRVSPGGGSCSVLSPMSACATRQGGDEPYYVQAGYDYALDLRQGRPQAIAYSSFIPEHPAFTKLVYAGAILLDWSLRGYAPLTPSDDDHTYHYVLHESPTFARYQLDARIASAACGTLLVAMLAIFSPATAVFALLSTIVVAITSLSGLDAPGLLFSTAAILLYLRFRTRDRIMWALCLAGVAMGIATAAKYYYAVTGVVILLDWLATARIGLGRRAAAIVAYVGVALVTFCIADPPFLTQGMRRMLYLLHLHGLAYANTVAHVNVAGFHAHWYAPLTNLLLGFADWYSPRHSPYLLNVDPLIMALAILGIAVTWWRYTIVNLWLTLAVAALLINPIKYPWYIALAVIPVCFSAASGGWWLWAMRSIPLTVTRPRLNASRTFKEIVQK